jgi:trimeric autotransporter adhesin
MSQAGTLSGSGGGGGGGSNVQTLTGNTGGAVPPTANNINVVGTGAITVAGNPGTSTLTISSSTVSGITTIDGDTGSVTGSTVSIETLPGINGGTASFSGSGTTLTFLPTDSSQNTCLGQGSMVTASNTGSTAIGYQALASGTSTQQNVAIGYQALTKATSGVYNIAVGQNTMSSFISGNSNLAMGQGSMSALTGATGNTAVGVASLAALVTGGANSAFGYLAGLNYTGAESNNVVISNSGIASESNVIRIGTQGSGTGQQNECFIAGIFNNDSSGFTSPLPVFVDSSTGQLGFGSSGGSGITTIDGDTGSVTGSTVTIETNKSSNGGTSIFSGSGTTMQFIASDSNQNTGFGTGSLISITSGNFNVALGYNALNLATTTSENVAIGYSALSSMVNGGHDNVAVGPFCLENLTGPTAQSNTAVGQSTMRSATLLKNCSCYGVVAGFSLTTGDNNTAIGSLSLQNCITGTNNTSLGYQSAINYTGAESSNIIIGNAGVASESNVIRIGTQGSGAGQQSSAYIAGVAGVTVSNTNMVTIDTSTGQLGSQAISAGGITTVAGDTGSVTGSTVTITGASTAGATVKFVGSGATLSLDTSDGSGLTQRNTFIGLSAGNGSYTGSKNTGVGYNTLHAITSGTFNTAFGGGALSALTTGTGNMVLGQGALQTANGSYNVGIGYTVGINYTGTESDNILIQNQGVTGENNVIRIGTQGTGNAQQNICYISGIAAATYSAGSPTPSLTYCDTSDGQLVSTAAVASSSATSTFGSLVVGTARQNTATYAILVNVSIVVTAATGATIVLGIGSTNTPTTNTVVTTFTVAAASTYSFSGFVPAGYYMLVNTTGTITVGSITTQTCAVG